MNRSAEFFDTQFRKQVANRDFALNPFETAVLPFVRGRVLDLGCGLGNLSIEAARKGARVVAVDSSPTAIVRVVEVSRAENLGITAVLADVAACRIAGDYDTIVAIGLLMFMPCDLARRLLSEIREHVARAGHADVERPYLAALLLLELAADGLAAGHTRERDLFRLGAADALLRLRQGRYAEQQNHDEYFQPCHTP